MFQLSDGTTWNLAGHHFIGNVIYPNKIKSNELILPDQDPRNARLKPDAFPVLVEEVGPRCSFVSPGDTVVIERWMWKQFNVDKERMIASEADLLILNNSIPAPGVIVMKIIEDVKKSPLIIPQTSKPKNQSYVHGLIVNSSHPSFREGIEIWVEKLDHNQYRFEDKMIFRVNEEMARVLGTSSVSIKPTEARKIELEVV